MKRKYWMSRFSLDAFWALLYLSLGSWFLLDAVRLVDPQSAIFFGIHLTMALLFLVRRRPLARSGRPAGYVVAVCSMLYIYLFDLRTPDGPFTQIAGTLTMIGSVGCLLAVTSLGRCWGVLPICRGIETRWLYRLVRHPIYASYLLLDVGIVLGHLSVWNTAVLVGGVVLYLHRIHFEEEVLARLEEYELYRSSVRFRLIPLLY